MKALSIVIFLMMVVSTSVQSQPLQREWLWQRLMTTMDISSMSEVERSRVLKELLRYDSLMQFTSFVNDSTHALLKQRIGAIYFHGDDLSNAQAYMKQAVTITTAGANKNTSIKHNIRNYYNLAWMYDVTGDIPERIKSLDSCAGLSIRLGITDYYVVLSLTSLYEYWYGIGDYKRSINYADLGEKYARIFAAGSHSQSDSTWGIKFALLAHFWKVNALLRLKDYAIAEKLVAEKVAECKSDILPRPYLATLYQQFAEISLSRKNYKEAHEYLKKALEFDIRARDSAGCRVQCRRPVGRWAAARR